MKNRKVKTGTLEKPQGCGTRLFTRKPRKKQIPNPVQKPNGVRYDIFFEFFRSLLI
jgi:hypothetical protein